MWEKEQESGGVGRKFGEKGQRGRVGKWEGAAPPPQAAKAGGACFAPAEPERAAPDEAMVRQRPAKEEKKKPLPREKSGQGNKAENYSSSLRTAMKASWGTSTLPS